MARQTKKQIREQAALAVFEEALRALPDPRRKQGQRYPLESVVVIALMATVCGCDDGVVSAEMKAVKRPHPCTLLAPGRAMQV
jgi:hypothetical protein